jgi:hypothetical protein
MTEDKDWRDLCAEAATEMDPEKLMDLVSSITKALDERDVRRNSDPQGANGTLAIDIP